MSTILITGTSQGIGHALTKLLLINGYKVIGTNTTGIDNIDENNYKSYSLDLSNFDSIAISITASKSAPEKSFAFLITL